MFFFPYGCVGTRTARAPMVLCGAPGAPLPSAATKAPCVFVRSCPLLFRAPSCLLLFQAPSSAGFCRPLLCSGEGLALWLCRHAHRACVLAYHLFPIFAPSALVLLPMSSMLLPLSFPRTLIVTTCAILPRLPTCGLIVFVCGSRGR